MTKTESLIHAIDLLEEVDSLVQDSLDDCYDLYSKIYLLIDQIREKAEEEGIVLPE